MTSLHSIPEVTTSSVREFPRIGDRMRLAYLELWAAECQVDSDQPLPVSRAEDLPRPWDPASCHDRDLRREVWHWLDQVVDWLNTEYAWDVAALIPGCWYRHPHLVHDLGTLADQRRRAGLAFTSTPLEEWHRYTLPLFIDRVRERTKSFCEEAHKDPPGRARIQRYSSHQAISERRAWYDNDTPPRTPTPDQDSSEFWMPPDPDIDPITGEYS